MTLTNLAPLYKCIGYQFKDRNLLLNALTHRSAQSVNNERLEFLGDSILNFTAAEALYKKFVDAKEGDLSRLRALLVKGETLAEVAREMGLSDYLIMGEGELKSGGFRRASILADCVEAIIGAIYLEAGMEQTRQCILSWYQERIDNLSLSVCGKDAKSLLQEWLQGRKKPLPIYQVVKIDGDSHCQIFTVSCETAMSSNVIIATGSNRRQAEKEAAERMLQFLKESYS